MLHATRYRLHDRKGFTLIEILIVLAMIAVISTVGLLSLGNASPEIRVEQAAARTVALMQNARQRAIAQEDSARWGVYVDNSDGCAPAVIVFKVNEALAADPDYSGIPGTPMERTSLHSTLRFVEPEAGTAVILIFEKGTGLPQTSTTIVLITQNGSVQRDIAIDNNGRINIE